MAPDEMFQVVGEHVFPFLRALGGDGSTYAVHMRDARFTIPTPALLAKVVDGIDLVPMEGRDTKGDGTVRTSMDFVSHKDRKAVAAALKDIYRAVDATAAEAALAAFEAGPWGAKYPAIAQSWRRAWQQVIPFFGFPGEVRRIIYTTNAIKALNSKLRRAVRARGHFPNDDAAAKLLYLTLNRSEKEWVMPPRE